ncbi:MAG: glycerophosphodiester phosphodiesterase [Clostridia bacterium]|nr:glycerophosphodiester phosphodiesterase [Clostridia bacterium]
MDQTRRHVSFFSLFRHNRGNLAAFELIYRLGVALLFVPLLTGCLNLAMKVSGYAYLTKENVFYFAKSPLTVAFAVALSVLAAFLSMIDIGAVICTADASFLGRRASLSEITVFAVKGALKALKIKNLPILGVILLLAPLTGIGMVSAVLATVSLPGFVSRFVSSHTASVILAGALILLLSAAMMRRLYVFPCFLLEGRSCRDARRESRRLSRRHLLRDFGEMLLAQVLFSLLFAVTALLLVTASYGLVRLFSGALTFRRFMGSAVWLAVIVSLFIAFGLNAPVSYGCAAKLYFGRRAQPEEDTAPASTKQKSHERRRAFRLICLCALGIMILSGLALWHLVSSNRINPNVEFLRTVEITAHRGASAGYPENTMAAFRAAQELGADWLELDVQQTKDGHLVVMHDSNARRTTGVNANIWDMTLEEVKSLDAGSRFGAQFAGEKVPLLSEVIEFADETGVRLNIELKPTGHETELEKSTVDLILQYGFQDRCVIASQVYSVLKNVKELSEEIPTVYVASLAYGNISRLAYADHFSVETASASRNLVRRVHNAGKQIYAWTVNTRDGISGMIDRNVDNIITDDVSLALQCVYESRYSDLLTEFVEMLEAEE